MQSGVLHVFHNNTDKVVYGSEKSAYFIICNLTVFTFRREGPDNVRGPGDGARFRPRGPRAEYLAPTYP